MQYCNIGTKSQYPPLQLHQFAVFTLILTLGDFLGHTIVYKSLHLTVDIVRIALVAEAYVNILTCKGIRQSTIAYPRLLPVRVIRSLLSFLIVVVLFANSQEEMLLKSEVGIDYE